MDLGGDAGQRTVELAQTRSLLRNRPFRRLWAAQFISVSVTYALTLAGAVLVEEQTASAAQIGLVLLSAILPAFLASLVAGAIVDRWGRAQMLMISYFARALVALGFWLGTSQLPPDMARATVYAANVAGAVFAQFAIAAELSLIPELVSQRHLMSANSLTQLSILVAEGLGVLVLSPLVVKSAGVPTMGIVAALLFVLAFALVAALPKGKPSTRTTGEHSAKLPGLWADLQEGWREIARDRVLRVVAAQATLAAVLILVLLSLAPGLATRYLGLGVEDAPLLGLPAGVGFLIGALLLSRLGDSLSRQAWIAVGLTGLGLVLGLLAALSSDNLSLAFAVVLPLVLGLGFTLALVTVPARTVLQERPPPSVRGRVIAAQLALSHAASVLPLLLGGTLADHLGMQPVLAILSLLAIGGGAIGLHQLRN